MKGDADAMSLLPNSTSLQVLYMGDKAEIVIEEMTSALPAADVHRILEAAGWELIAPSGHEPNVFKIPLFDGLQTFEIERWRRKA